MRLPGIGHIEAAVEYFSTQLSPLMQVPFAFFGHSMGAAVSFELARVLAEQGGPSPQWLGLSGMSPPRPSLAERLPSLTDEGLLDYLRNFQNTPSELLANPQFRSLLLEALRADVSLVQSWLQRPPPPKLAIPVHVFMGENDPQVSPYDMGGWSRFTSSSYRESIFPGDHFFLLQPSRDAVLQVIAQALSEHLPPV